MRLVGVLFISFLTAWTGWAGGWDGIPAKIDTNQLQPDDRLVPFPWSLQDPLAEMEGTWYVKNGRFESFFIFKNFMVSGQKRLRILQVDADDCKPVAYGMGSMSRSSKTLSSFMEYIDFDQSYTMMVRAYNYTGPVKDLDIRPFNGKAIVISIQPENRSGMIHMPLSRMSGSASLSVCRTHQ